VKEEEGGVESFLINGSKGGPRLQVEEKRRDMWKKKGRKKTQKRETKVALWKNLVGV